jgi:hypothetical protein
MTISVLTPLQMIAGSGLLQGQGLVPGATLSVAIGAYSNTAVMTAFFEALALDSSLATLAANSVPAFSNSVPGAYSALGTQMSNVVTAQSQADFGGSISKFIQALNLSLAYTENTNIFINSAVNSQTYLANTFTSTNDSITGDVTSVNLATPVFGQDLDNLGNLIDLDNLGDLGSPLALVKRLVEVSGNISVLTAAFILVGVPTEIVFNLSSPTLTVTDSVQKLMYQAMTQITGSDLNQILQILSVTTTGINTMADLLDPTKLFPNSFASLTVKTANGLRSIYENSNGAVNSKLVDDLPPYVLGATT